MGKFQVKPKLTNMANLSKALSRNTIFYCWALSLAAALVAVWAWISPGDEGLVGIDGNGFYMAADARCSPRPILTASVWLDCDFGGKNVVILARSSADFGLELPLFDFDLRKEMLAALVADTPLEQFADQVRNAMWGVGTQTRFSGEAFLFPATADVVSDGTKMVMFHAIQEGNRTIGVVAVGDHRYQTPGPEQLLIACQLAYEPC